MEEDLGCDREQPLSTPKNLLPSGARGFRRKTADSLCAPLGRALACACVGRWPHARSPGVAVGERCVWWVEFPSECPGSWLGNWWVDGVPWRRDCRWVGFGWSSRTLNHLHPQQAHRP